MEKVNLIITENLQVNYDTYLMTLSGDLTSIKNPGEFINISVPGFYLRRPISVLEYTKDYVKILYKVLGHGTKEMSLLSVGSTLDCLVGLGNGFLDINVKKPLLVAGGIGIAPLVSLAKHYNSIGIKPTLIYGAAKKEDLLLTDELNKLTDLRICTDDGSLGFKGNCVSYLKENEVSFDKYFSCGPIRMLEALASYNQNGYLSLEARMGCGFGACMGCSIKTTNGFKRVCKEGPVFLASEVIF